MGLAEIGFRSTIDLSKSIISVWRLRDIRLRDILNLSFESN